MPQERRHVSDPNTQRALDRQRQTLNDLSKQVEGVAGDATKFAHIGDTDLADATIVKIKHKLGADLKGWAVTDLRGPTATGRIERVLVDGASSANDREDLWLKATGHGATVTVRLLVY